MILGIDVGGSTTKIVGLNREGECFGMMQVDASDQLTSAYGAFGKFTAAYNLSMRDIKKIMLTGVGAAHLGESMYDIPAKRVDEFKSIGLGGLKLAGLKKAIIISAGTGTALVRASKEDIRHLGGSGLGGGTLQNLSGRIAGASHFASIIELAAFGDLSAVDLTLGDITREQIGNLPPHTTVANFGNLQDGAGNADIVLGLVNMIFESIGMMAVFAALNDDVKDIVMVGSLSVLDQAVPIFNGLSAMHNLHFYIPEGAIFATALGAALSGEGK
jgi:type II pantothenate kinase